MGKASLFIQSSKGLPLSSRTKLSGFPEYLPSDRIVEQDLLRRISETFELYGYVNIETRAVEPLPQLLSKGETSKEVYILQRLQEYLETFQDDEAGTNGAAESKTALPPQRNDSKRIGLHFDLTVPLARYVAEHAGKLQFPFKRYQIQKVWRGERPQDGRFREFTQADIDVVAPGELPLHYDIEIPLVMGEALSQLPIPPVTIMVNNRNLSEGFYRGIGITDTAETLRTMDKIDKVSAEVLGELLRDNVGASQDQVDAAIALAEIKGDHETLETQVRDLLSRYGTSNEQFERGLSELIEVLRITALRKPGLVQANLRIARGLDYYTGTVYESFISGHEDLGSICSGGRYDSLVTIGKQSYPGVGMSIGVSRLLSRFIGKSLRASRSVPTVVYIALLNEEDRLAAEQRADVLRSRGISALVSVSSSRIGRQIRDADRLGIPYVWFFSPQAEDEDEVKDIRSGEQVCASVQTWVPDPDTMRPTIEHISDAVN